MCPFYMNFCDNLFSDQSISSVYDLPFVPSTLFKDLDLKSIHEDDIYKTMVSSGTTGQQRSKIFLNKATASAQQRALTRIVTSALGTSRVPMLVMDSISQIKDRTSFSARGAGILGFMMFGTKRSFALDERSKMCMESIKKFSSLKTEQTKFLFGFTAIIWEEILQFLESGSAILGDQEAVLIHGGGWKKLAEKNIDNRIFLREVKSKLGVNVEVIDYYGMVEQTGSIFLADEEGVFSTNEYNDIIIRDPKTLRALPNGSVGVAQVLSVLPESYPGFSILTEDLGCILRDEVSSNGSIKKRFVIKGRMPKTEIRGCGNTYER